MNQLGRRHFGSEYVLELCPAFTTSHSLQARLWKVLVTIILAAALAIQTASLAWSAVETSRPDIIVYSLQVIFALYLVVLSSLSVRQEYAAHWRSLLHLGTLTCLAGSLLGIIFLIPSTPLPVALSSSEPTTVVPQGLEAAVIVLYITACVILINIPRSPPLHYPSERIYSEKTLMQVTSKYEDNVCGSVSASIWNALMFSFTTKVVMLGNTSESLEIGDLPITPADMRATYVFATMRAGIRKWKLRIGSWRPTPGSGFEIGYSMVRVNSGALFLVVILASVSAVLFYAPAFFLRKVVAYLEADPDRTDRSWGWTWCIALVLSNVVSQLSKTIYVSISPKHIDSYKQSTSNCGRSLRRLFNVVSECN